MYSSVEMFYNRLYSYFAKSNKYAMSADSEVRIRVMGNLLKEILQTRLKIIFYFLDYRFFIFYY